MPLLIPALLVGLFIAILIWRRLKALASQPLCGQVEYWIYNNIQRIPPTAALMDAVVNKNPYNKPGQPAITAREGILFSDIRLHMAVAKREKNPEAFRPDLFEDHVEVTGDILETLSNCTSLVTIQYSSNKPLPDSRHLQFTTHLADAVGRLTKGQLIYDTITHHFWRPDELAIALHADNYAERPELHLRVLWTETSEGCRASTLGLKKVGRPELQTAWQEKDSEILTKTLLEMAARRLFENKLDCLPMDLEVSGAQFTLREASQANSVITVQILRKLKLS